MRNALVLTAVMLSAFAPGQLVLAQDHTNDRKGQIRTALRMIGHEILMQSGDSTSRVLPVRQDGTQFRIQLESEFGFEPSVLVETIDRIIQEAGIAERYMVEVESCQTGLIVYGYQKGLSSTDEQIPCTGREQPIGCYQILLTLLETDASSQPVTGSSLLLLVLILFPPFIALLLVMSNKTRNKYSASDEHIMDIGRYTFDQRNLILSLDGKNSALTSKEADLLYVLFSAVNQTIKREQILYQVWGDEGDYIGRTLDVFISRLRKKLEADPSISIKNIRGVGYRLIVD